MRWTLKGWVRLCGFNIQIQRWTGAACVTIVWTAPLRLLCLSCLSRESHQVCMVTPQARCVPAESSECTLFSICSLPAEWPRSTRRIRAPECKTFFFLRKERQLFNTLFSFLKKRLSLKRKISQQKKIQSDCHNEWRNTIKAEFSGGFGENFFIKTFTRSMTHTERREQGGHSRRRGVKVGQHQEMLPKYTWWQKKQLN